MRTPRCHRCKSSNLSPAPAERVARAFEVEIERWATCRRCGASVPLTISVVREEGAKVA